MQMEKQAHRVVRQQLVLLEQLAQLELLVRLELLELLAEQHRLLIMPMVPLIMMARGIIDQ